eukprot:gene22588-29724_t
MLLISSNDDEQLTTAILPDDGCYFLQKAWYAQLAGADMLLISSNDDEQLTTAILPDDGDWGGTTDVLPKLKIAVAMISKEDATHLKDLYKEGSVTLSLNWSSILPRQKQVDWELWTNSNDECGSACTEQQSFVKKMRPFAKSVALPVPSSNICGSACAEQQSFLKKMRPFATRFEQAKLTNFSPHYLMWTCQAEYVDSEECQSKCIQNGTYCSPDPDGDIHVGYKGSDVLLMNVRQLCFFRLAKASAKRWLWWDYAEYFGGNCTMATKNFTAECALQIFKDVGGANFSAGYGLQDWNACINEIENPDNSSTRIDILQQEMISESANNEHEAVAIIPTVRVNGVQYRGDLDVPGVMRALCSAFTLGQEPGLCNELWISDDECEVGGAGVEACKVRCTGPLPYVCVAEHNYGTCWEGSVNDMAMHACVDDMDDFKSMAAVGQLPLGKLPFHCHCPLQGCMEGNGEGPDGCRMICDEQDCVGDSEQAVCLPGTHYAIPTSGGEAGKHAAHGGVWLVRMMRPSCTTIKVYRRRKGNAAHGGVWLVRMMRPSGTTIKVYRRSKGNAAHGGVWLVRMMRPSGTTINVNTDLFALSAPLPALPSAPSAPHHGVFWLFRMMRALAAQSMGCLPPALPCPLPPLPPRHGVFWLFRMMRAPGSTVNGVLPPALPCPLPPLPPTMASLALPHDEGTWQHSQGVLPPALPCPLPPLPPRHGVFWIFRSDEGTWQHSQWGAAPCPALPSAPSAPRHGVFWLFRMMRAPGSTVNGVLPPALPCPLPPLPPAMASFGSSA